MKQTILQITGMDCPTEEQIIRNRLKAMDGIERLDFNLMERELTVVHTLDDDRTILQALESLKMGARLKTGMTDAEEAEQGGPESRRAVAMERLVIGLSGVLALGSEVVAWSTGKESSPLVVAIAIVSIALGGRETARKGLTALRTGTLNMNFLMTIAIVGAMFIGQWPEAAMVTFLFGLAEVIEGYSLDRARNAIRALMEMTPATATVRDPAGQWQSVDAGAVREEQTVWVRPGERIPLDGVVTSGATTVNQAPITGESLPVEKAVGDAVFAGTVNERGSFEFRVTANKGNTTLARIVRAVQQAQSERAPTQRFVDGFARYYTPAVVAFAVLVAAVPPLLFHAPFQPWLYKALVMLVIACPCALVISTPVTVVSGLASAAKHGILVKGGAYLEGGRRLKVVALDKTGTITHGRPAVTDVIPMDGVDPDAALHLAASLDAHSEHPVASAIVAKWTGVNGGGDGAACPTPEAAQRSGDLLPVTDFEAITGRGVKGRVDGRTYTVGNHWLCEEMGACSLAVEEALKRLEREGKTTVVLTTADEALAVFGVADTVRDTSIAALKELHALGVRSVMLTGDNQTTADAIARKVGIDDARGNLLPEEKQRAIADLTGKYGPVGMVGDGINDAPALASAAIGFAMGAAGTDTAIETADVALMEDDLRKLPEFIALSRQTGRVLVQNIVLAIGIKAVFFALALTGVATLWMAVFADMGASLLVVFNGLRLLRFRSS